MYVSSLIESLFLEICTCGVVIIINARKFDKDSDHKQKLAWYYSRCSFSMMVKWGANDGLLQANDGKMLVNDGEILDNDGEMSLWYTHFTIIDEHLTIISLM